MYHSIHIHGYPYPLNLPPWHSSLSFLWNWTYTSNLIQTMMFMVCLLSNDEIKIRILNTWQLSFIICLFYLFEKVSLLIKALIKKFSLYSTSFYIYFYNYLDLYELEFIWTLFKIYDSDVFYFILFEFMIKYLFLK